MARFILLDSGLLNLACLDPSLTVVGQFRAWMIARVLDGTTIGIPAICDYEVRRAMIRQNATAKLKRLNDLRDEHDCLEIDFAALKKAAEFWAGLRRIGKPTADDKSLDADAILAGIAATIGGLTDSVLVATTNIGHLARFPGVDAQLWESIT